MSVYQVMSGKGNGMFCLYEVEYRIANGGAYSKFFYIKNLSRTWEKAVAKAKAFISDDDKIYFEPSNLNDWGDADKWTNLIYEPSPEDIKRMEEEKAKREAEKAQRDREYEEQKAKERAIWEKAEPIPVTDERIKFTGYIEKSYYKETQWGNQLKCFFVDDRGFKINGSVPSFEDRYVDDNERISFMAKVVVSDNDIKFGFFKRPSQVTKL